MGNRICAGRCLALLALLACVSSLGSADWARARPHHAARCKPRGSHTIVVSATLRVYRSKTHRDSAGSRTDNVFTCWRPTGRTTNLGSEHSDPNGDVGSYQAADQVKIASGRIIAVRFTSCCGVDSGSESSVTSLDVRTGQKIHDTQDFADCQADRICIPKVSSYIVTPIGSVAWIGNSGEAVDSVHGVGAGGKAQLLDPGSVPVSSLAFANGMLSWQSGTQTRSVPFQ